MKIKKIFLLSILVLLLLGVSYASEVNNNTMSTDTTYTTEQTSSTTSGSIDTRTTTNEISTPTNIETGCIDKNINTTRQTNNTRNVKTLSQTYDITDYNSLYSALRGNSYSNITINIKSDIKLKDNIELYYTTKTLTINGNNKTIDGNNKYRFLYFSGATVNICNLKIINCYSEEDGGALYYYSNSELNVENTTFINNHAEYYGGAIYYYDSNLYVKNCTFIDNDAIDGGAIYNDGIKYTRTDNYYLTIRDSQFNNNTAYEGGAIYNKGNYLRIWNTQFNNNTAYEGGAIYSIIKTANIKYDNSADIYSCNFINNIASEDGGAIYDENQNLDIYYSTFKENKASGNGGAIHNIEGLLNIIQSTLNNNRAEKNGGAINSKSISINGGNLHNNTGKSGGAISIITYPYESITLYDGDEYNMEVYITNNVTFINNHAENDGGAIFLYNTNNTNIKKSNFENNTANYGGAIYIKGNNSEIKSNTFKYNQAKNGSAIYNEKWTLNTAYTSLSLKTGQKKIIESHITIENNIFQQNKAISTGNAIKTIGDNINIYSNMNANTSKYSNTIYVNGTEITIISNTFRDSNKTLTRISLIPVTGIIGENITFYAWIYDDQNSYITGGNLVFKLNGKTLRSDNSFNSTASALKLSVKNGTVTYTIKADLYLRNAKNLTASYSGTSTYQETTSETVTAQIQKRYASLTVTTTPNKAKQYETITFTIKAKDTTKNGKNNTLISDNTKVMLKVNGVTLKDKNNQTLYISLDKNAQTTYKYTIPRGTGGITNDKTVRNYSVTAIFIGDNYYPNARNTTYFNVERSNTTININKVTVNKNNTLSIKATLKDYKANNLLGINKVTLKINGKSYTQNEKPVYWSVKDGNINLNNIQIDKDTTIKRVMIVTGERQAYLEGRNETTTITRT